MLLQPIPVVRVFMGTGQENATFRGDTCYCSLMVAIYLPLHCTTKGRIT